MSFGVGNAFPFARFGFGDDGPHILQRYAIRVASPQQAFERVSPRILTRHVRDALGTHPACRHARSIASYCYANTRTLMDADDGSVIVTVWLPAQPRVDEVAPCENGV